MTDVADRLLSAYVRATGAARPLGRAVVAIRRRMGKEHPDRWPERFGIASQPAPGGPTVWVHAASVGESVAVLPLVARIAAAGVAVVLTTVTTTSAAFLAGRLPEGVTHQFVPLDIAPCIDRFLATWRPQLAVFAESEIWPVAVQRLAAAAVPLVVSNARMSDRSFSGWMRVPAAARAIFGRVGLALAQSEADARRFATLGALRTETVGNIKFDAPVPEAPRAAAAALAAAMHGRPVLLAASTHPGEETILLDAFDRIAPALPGAMLVIAPRHPERGAEVMSLAVARHLDVCQRSAGALPSRSTAVYVADTVGELGTFYRLAPVCLVGGSLVDHGGHNPIEPGRLGSAVITGPSTAAFRDIYAAFLSAGAAVVAGDRNAIAEAALRLLSDRTVRDRQVAAALTVVERYAGALDRTWAVLEPLVAPIAVASRLGLGMTR